jgi:hypothetical protein
MKIHASHLSIQRVCVIMGPWRIGFLFSACLATMTLILDETLDTWFFPDSGLLLFYCGTGFFVVTIKGFYQFSDIYTRTTFRTMGLPYSKWKIVRTYPVSASALTKMEKPDSRWLAFCLTILLPALIGGFVVWYARKYEAVVDYHHPAWPYGFYVYPLLLVALGIPWHLLFGRKGKRCPYCLTPRTIDSFDSEHHICLRCHTKYVAENEKNEPHPPVPESC